MFNILEAISGITRESKSQQDKLIDILCHLDNEIGEVRLRVKRLESPELRSTTSDILIAENKELHLRVEQLSEMVRWRSPKNPPKIYTEVLVLASGIVGVGKYMGYGDWTHPNYPVLGQCKPTGWLPIPRHE